MTLSPEVAKTLAHVSKNDPTVLNVIKTHPQVVEKLCVLKDNDGKSLFDLVDVSVILHNCYSYIKKDPAIIDTIINDPEEMKFVLNQKPFNRATAFWSTIHDPSDDTLKKHSEIYSTPSDIQKKLQHVKEKSRDSELRKQHDKLSDHVAELDSLPEIFKVRIAALKEVNPQKFTGEKADINLELSSLVAMDIISQMSPTETTIDKNLYKNAHKKYGVDLEGKNSVNPYLVNDLVLSYFSDMEKGIINSSGKIIGDISKSEVMSVFHNNKINGMPNQAHHTIAQIKQKVAQRQNINVDRVDDKGHEL